MVLVDYKGGATFAPFAALPHVAGVITNLENDAGLSSGSTPAWPARSSAASRSSRTPATSPTSADYAALRAGSARTCRRCRTCSSSSTSSANCSPPSRTSSTCSCRSAASAAPSACTCCCPASASRAASSRAWTPTSPTGSGLRTFSADETRTVLDTPDAFHLPPLPGFGYLKVDTSVYERFKAGYVSGPYQGRGCPRRRRPRTVPPSGRAPYPPYSTRPGQARGRGRAEGRHGRPAGGDRADRAGRDGRPAVKPAATPVPQIWLPPLPTALHPGPGRRARST